jgi:pimeloyl-ACP methyl ester carboxylesterase
MATLVLVHGAFEGGWCWGAVARRLRAAGHEVVTPTLTGSGERFHLLSREVSLETHLRDLDAVLTYEDLREVILVGHSYGGTVVTGAAARNPERVARIVYLDASAPRPGQSASGAFADGTADKLDQLAAGEGWLLPPLPAAAVGVTEPARIAWLDARRHPHPMRTLLDPLPIAAEPAQPRRYVQCLRHEALVELFGVDPLASFVDRARAEGWPLTTLDAPHDAMLTHPEDVAALLLAEAGER